MAGRGKGIELENVLRPGRKNHSNGRSNPASRSGLLTLIGSGGIDAMTDTRHAPTIRPAVGLVTPILLVACTVAFVVTTAHCVGAGTPLRTVALEPFTGEGACLDTLRTWGGLDVATVWLDGAWWRVASAGLLHGHWLHLGLNGWSLWVVGPWVERALGAARTGALFGLSSVGGCLASLAWAEAPLVVGASAGVMGLAGALWGVRLWGRVDIRERVSEISALALGICLVLLLGLGAVVPVIAQAGHIGGLVVGLALGWGWGLTRRSSRRAGLIGAWACLVILAALSRKPTWRWGYHAAIGYTELDRGHLEAAARALDGALVRRPRDPELMNGVAYALAEAGVELDRAVALGQDALELAPEDPNILDTVGWALCRAGRPGEGAPYLARASSLSEGTVDEIEGHVIACGTATAAD